MSYVHAQLYNNQDMSGETSSLPGYFVSSSQARDPTRCGWNGVYGPEYFDSNAMLGMFQVPQPSNWFSDLEWMSNGPYQPCPLPAHHQYELGGPAMATAQGTTAAQGFNIGGRPSQPNFACPAASQRWPTPVSTTAAIPHDTYQAPFPLGDSLDGSPTAAAAGINYPLPSPRAGMHTNGYHTPPQKEVSTMTGFATSTSSTRQQEPASCDGNQNLRSSHPTPSPEPGQIQAQIDIRKKAMAMEGLKRMERTLKADTQLRIRQVRQSMPR
ncbi:hypothetical protein F5Y17DRAFT_433446 [Xylariaceae sp. FL0594]|nr:hypothetical protein F5Y17DRAFT_433446 [Xylariaceae sp. FL0594]